MVQLSLGHRSYLIFYDIHVGVSYKNKSALQTFCLCMYDCVSVIIPILRRQEICMAEVFWLMFSSFLFISFLLLKDVYHLLVYCYSYPLQHLFNTLRIRFSVV